MKVIALKHFANNIGLELKDAIHPRHVEKGTLLEIGGDKPTKEEKILLAQLQCAGCIGDANDASLVKRVNAEIAAEARREQNVSRINSAAAAQALSNQLGQALSAVARAAA